MSESTYPPPSAFSARSPHVASMDQYQEIYNRSIEENEAFWAEQALRIHWFEKPTQVKDVSYAKDDLHIKWYADGKTNACFNAVDRHVFTHPDQTALIFEADDPNEEARHISYKELLEQFILLFLLASRLTPWQAEF